MVAASFQDTGRTTLDLSKITTTATVGQYASINSASQLLVWDPEFGNGIGRYLTFYYISDAIDSNDDEVTAWADIGGDAVENVTLSLGSAVWFYCPGESGKTVTVAGEVSSEDDLTVSAVIAGYTMIANPFPVQTDVNTVEWFGTDGVTPLVPSSYASINSAPQILVWDPEFGNGIGRYLTYYYISDAIDSNDDEVTAWADVGGDAVTDKVAAGQGFWLFLPSGYAGAKATFAK